MGKKHESIRFFHTFFLQALYDIKKYADIQANDKHILQHSEQYVHC